MKEESSFQDFLGIIEMLRSGQGCPWDREQTHESLRSCMIEEAYELVAAIRIYSESKDTANLKEELGDVLLQVVMHCQIASEEGLFTIQDVIEGISDKMIRRHPHVFGDTVADTSQKVLKNWEDIKQKEKKDHYANMTALREIPQEFPALIRAAKVQKKASKEYSRMVTEKESLMNIKELAELLEKNPPKESKNDILGELLMAVANYAYQEEINAEMSLQDKIESFIKGYGE